MRKAPIPASVREKYPHHRPAFIQKIEGVHVKQVAARYESRKEWRKDPKGYFVIKVFYDKGYFGARYHTYDNVPRLDIIGTDAEAIVQTIVRENLVTTLQHAAYLGHELYKAQVALERRLNFVQDSSLDFKRKTKKKESDNLPE